MISFFNKTILLFSAALLILLSSCLTPIDIDLPVDLRIVVEGNIVFDRDNPADTLTHFIKLTNSQGFISNDDFTLVKDAVVEVRDDSGNRYRFEFVDDREQYESKFIAVPGRTYTLSIITADNQQYEASDRIPITDATLNNIEIVEYENAFLNDGLKTLFPIIKFSDPNAEKNYYSFDLKVNNKVVSNLQNSFTPVLSDDNFNGQESPIIMVYRSALINSKDTVIVNLNSISQEYFTFQQELSTASRSSNSPFGGSPPRPVLGNVKNLTDNDKPGLGFFATVSSSSAMIVVE